MEEKEENVVEETTQQQTEQNQEEKQPEVDLSKFESKDDPDVIKVDLSKKPEEEIDKNQETTDVTDDNQTEVIQEVVEEKTPEQSIEKDEETPVLEEITDEVIEEKTEEVQDKIDKAIEESKETGKPIPENIQKLIDFMEETGGSMSDYIRLNQDYSEMDNHTLLKEYYKQTKPHLNSGEIEFMMEDYFSYDEEVDEDRDIKRKKLALKEQVAQAKQHLDSVKSKYYEEIQYGSKLTSEQQKAIDFFNRYNKESKEQKEIADQQQRTFLNRTDNLFNKDFKGFEYKVGEKRFRFNVKDSQNVKEQQSDISNFVKKFLNKNNEIEDAKGYHKSLYTAMNPDAIASHFYEQGKADALKQSVAKSKNINMDPRQQHSEQVNTSGLKFKVLGQDSSDFKFKIKNNK